MKRPALSIALALGATLVMTVTAAASSTYTESIHGTELPNATPTEGQFVGEATGSLAGAWYISRAGSGHGRDRGAGRRGHG